MKKPTLPLVLSVIGTLTLSSFAHANADADRGCNIAISVTTNVINLTKEILSQKAEPETISEIGRQDQTEANLSNFLSKKKNFYVLSPSNASKADFALNYDIEMDALTNTAKVFVRISQGEYYVHSNAFIDNDKKSFINKYEALTANAKSFIPNCRDAKAAR